MRFQSDGSEPFLVTSALIGDQVANLEFVPYFTGGTVAKTVHLFSVRGPVLGEYTCVAFGNVGPLDVTFNPRKLFDCFRG